MREILNGNYYLQVTSVCVCMYTWRACVRTCALVCAMCMFVCVIIYECDVPNMNVFSENIFMNIHT